MKVSKEQFAENRGRILRAASNLFRERGLDDVTIDEVTERAGLTRGAFYSHFKSKDDLVIQACGYAVEHDDRLRTRSYNEFITGYLTASHRDDRADGCAYAALASEVSRQPVGVRHAMSEALKGILDIIASNAPGTTDAERRVAALASTSAVVGAMILARMTDDPILSDELIAANLKSLVRLESAKT